MSAEPNYETQRIDHLGIVAGVCQEISLIEQIDRQVKARACYELIEHEPSDRRNF
jgi:hypothetical protein